MTLEPRDKLDLLTRAARLLSSTTDFDTMLRQTIAACLPGLGDFGFFDLRVSNDEVRRTSLAHEDPRIDAILRPTRWVRQVRPDMNLCALSTGDAAVHPDIDDGWYRRIAANDEHLAVLRDLGFRSMLTVPMRFGDELVGALTLFYGRSGRRHDHEQMELAGELAASVVPIVVNARLVERQRRTEEALRASEERLRLAIDAGRLGTWDWNITRNEVVWSDRVYELHGVAPGAFGGRVEDFAALIHPDDRARVEEAIGVALRERDSYEVEFRTWTPAGTDRWLATRANVIRGPGGEPVRMVGATYDITSRVELLAAERSGRDRFELLARAGAVLTGSLDTSATLDAISRALVPAVADWCRVDLYDAAGELQHVLSHNADPSLSARAAEIATKYSVPPSVPGGVAWVAEHGTPHATLIERAVIDAIPVREFRQFVIDARLKSSLSVPLIARDATIGVLTVLRCEDRPHQLGPADIPLFAELAGRAALALAHARLFEHAERARRDAEAANQAKDEFLAILGHELRNPLAPITTALHLMSLRAGDVSRREREIIQRQVAHLSRLVDDLLDVSRIVRGKVELARQRVDLRAVVEKAVEMTRPLFDGNDQRLDLQLGQAPAWSDGDPTRLAQVFSNLLTNAGKFSPGSSPVSVSIVTEGPDHLVMVRDRGAGIDASLLPRVFDLFVQGQQSIDRRKGGLGLGLSIVANLVGLHGGRVTAQSDGPGQGATFCVRLPGSREEIAETSGPDGAGPRSRRARVLVVDDNADAGALLAEMLAAYGHEVSHALDGASALREAARVAPEIAVLDIGLPDMSGYELADRLRRLPGLAAVQLIALTGYGQASDRAAAQAAGFKRHFVKPVSTDALLSAFEALLAERARD